MESKKMERKEKALVITQWALIPKLTLLHFMANATSSACDIFLPPNFRYFMNRLNCEP